MRMVIKDWSKVDSELCTTDNKLISQEVKNNRKLLLSVLEEQSFINCPTEW